MTSPFDNRALSTRRNLSHVPVAKMAKQLRSFAMGQGPQDLQPGGAMCPQAAAIEFYLLEHGAGLVKQRVAQGADVAPFLPVLEMYHRRSMALALRAFYYLMLICSRESRHCKDKKPAASLITAHMMANADLCAAVPVGKVEAVLGAFPDMNDTNAVCNAYDSVCGTLNLGQLVTILQQCFTIGSFSPSYGGAKWATVTDCLRAFVFGETTAAMMLDTVWTLQHNTSAIFNKGMLFEQQSASALLTILDLQRAGQIPHLVAHEYLGKNAASSVSLTHKAQYIQFSAALNEPPFDGKATIDWVAVQQAGAVGKYVHLPKPPPSAKPAPPPEFVTPVPGVHYKKGPRHGKSVQAP